MCIPVSAHTLFPRRLPFFAVHMLTHHTHTQENCHNGNPTVPVRVAGDRIDCPMNSFRSSGDIRPQYGSILSNLMSTTLYNSGLAGPGCFAYPDMLEVGVYSMPTRGPLNFLTRPEARTHFAAWSIVSSPLVLSHDMTNASVMDDVWDIITNREVLAVNDAWVGDAGTLVKKSQEVVEFANCAWGFNRFCNHSATMVWKKHLDGNRTAMLLMNNRNVTSNVSVNWRRDLPSGSSIDCPAAGCDVRDIHARKNVGKFAEEYVARDLAPHDSAFIIVSY